MGNGQSSESQASDATNSNFCGNMSLSCTSVCKGSTSPDKQNPDLKLISQASNRMSQRNKNSAADLVGDYLNQAR